MFCEIWISLEIFGIQCSSEFGKLIIPEVVRIKIDFFNILKNTDFNSIPTKLGVKPKSD